MLLPSPTDRLILRCWQDEDFPAFARMNADSQMMEYFPAPLSLPESAAFFDRIRREFETEGFGLYALERRTDGELLGYTRLHRVTFDGPLYGRVEIGCDCAPKCGATGMPRKRPEAVFITPACRKWNPLSLSPP